MIEVDNTMSDAAIANILANHQEVRFIPGDYVRNVGITFLAGHQIHARGARFLANSPTITLFTAQDADNLEIDHLHMEGDRVALDPYAPQHGMILKDSRNVRIHGLTARNLKGRAWYRQTSGVAEPSRGIRGQFSDFMFQGNFFGFEHDGGVDCEYETYVNLNASDNGQAGRFAAGNLSIIGGNLTDNINGLEIVGTDPNNAHGRCVGVNFTHNSGFNIKMTDVTYGHTFVGCHVYGDSPTAGNVVITNSRLIRFDGGILDANFVVTAGSNTRVGKHCIDGAQIDGAQFQVTGARAIDVIITNSTDASGLSPKNTIVAGGSSSITQLFSGTRGTSALSIAAPQTALVFNNEISDPGNCYDSSTGIFTAPSTGLYEFNVSCIISGTSVTNGGFLTFLKLPSGGSVWGSDTYAGMPVCNTNLMCANEFKKFNLNAGDQVKIVATCPFGSSHSMSASSGNYLNIFKY